MKKWKNLCWLLLVLCGIVVLGIPHPVQATEVTATTYTSEQVGEGLRAELTGEGTLTIYGTGEMKNWGSSGSPWYKERNSIKKVVIESGVVSVGTYAFHNCAALTEVHLPSELGAIGNYAFRNCTALLEIILPAGLKTLGNNVFEGCRLLANVDLPTVLVSLGEYAFNNCSSLAEISIPDGITEIGRGTFQNCSALEHIDVNQVITVKANAFGSCTSLASIDLKNINVLENNAFNRCDALESITIPPTVTTVGTSGAFTSCGKLMQVVFAAGTQTIPPYACAGMNNLTTVVFETNTEGVCEVAEIGNYAFRNCTALPEIDLPAGVTALGNNVFEGCRLLAKVDLPTELKSLGEYAFINCIALSEIRIPDGITEIARSTFQNCTALESIDFNQVTTVRANACNSCTALAEIDLKGVSVLENNAFYRCDALESIEIPPTVTTVGSGGVFTNCGKLTQVVFAAGTQTIPPYACAGMNNLITVVFETNTEGICEVAEIGNYAFRNCTALTEIELPAGVTTLGNNVFEGCRLLADVDLPAGLASLGEYAFSNCGALTEIRIPDSVTEIGRGTFQNCKILESIDLNQVTTVKANAFYSCTALKHLELRNVETLENNAFGNCDALESVTIPASVTTMGSSGVFTDCDLLQRVVFSSGIQAIPANACRNMNRLTTVEFESNGEGTSDVASIGNYAFSNCSGLLTIALPDRLTSIGSEAFSGCSSLRDIVVPEAVGQIGNRAFANCTALRIVSLGSQLTADTINSNVFYRSALSELMVQTDNAWLREEYDWSKSNITPLYAVESFETGENGRVLAFENGFLAIVGSGAMADYASADEIPWQEYLGKMRYLFIGSNITHIGAHSFDGSALTDLWLRDCASLKTIGEYAFANSGRLDYIVIGMDVESIGTHAFYVPDSLCFLLESENTAAADYDWAGDNRIVDTETVIYKLTETALAYVKDETLMIRGNGPACDYSRNNQPWKNDTFTTVLIQDGITYLGTYSFYQMTGITDVIFPKIFTRIGNYAFSGCTGLSQIELPEELTGIGDYAFSECTALNRFTFPEMVSTIGSNAFNGCTTLQQVTLPKGLIKLGDAAFRGCTSVGTVNIECDALDTIPNDAFEGCSALRTLLVPPSVKRIARGAFASCEKLNTIRFSEGIAALEGGAFADCESLTSVKIPRSLTSASIYNNAGPFGTSLQKVTFAEKTRTIAANLFYGCIGLEEVSLPDTLSELEDAAFRGCTSLRELILPDTMSLIGEGAFYGCTALQDVALPEHIEEIGAGAFYGCVGIEAVSLPEDLQTLGNGAFENCTSLKTVTFSPDITAIPNTAFMACDLTEVHLPYKVKSIGRNAFAGNVSLELITIPAVTSSIASGAFADIPSLTIGGAAGSYAETFAEENSIAFDSQKGIAAEAITAKQTSLTLASRQTGTIRIEVAPDTMTDAIVWESSDAETISVKADADNPTEANVTSVKEGAAVITAKAGSVSQTISVTSENLVTNLSFDSSYLYLTELGETRQLKIRISPSNAVNSALVWKTSDKTIAAVDEEGTVTATGKGVARITAMLEDGSMRAYCFVNVNPTMEMTGIKLSDSALFLTSGGAALTAKILPEGSEEQALTWSSSDESVAVVDENGYVTAVNSGTAKITVSNVPKTPEDVVYSAECIVTVQHVDVHVERVTLDKRTIYLSQLGETAQLTATVYPENADLKDVSYKSSDEHVASVDEYGRITAGNSGTATITVKTLEGGYTAECHVAVSYQLTDISFAVNAMELKPGESKTVSATFEPASVTAPSVEWYTTNSRVATVDEHGIVTAAAVGKADIKCRSTDGTNIVAVCKVSVTERSEEKPGTEKPTVTPKPDTSQNTTNKPNTPSTPAAKAPVIKRAVILKITPGKKSLKLKWKKQSGITGYQIQYAQKKSFSGKKTVRIKSSKTTSKNITKLKSKKKYYIRIRAYKTVKGKKYYGSWSKAASKKTK